jgi:hypothetical protein
MRQIFGGAVLIIAGTAAFIEAHSHPPVAAERPGPLVRKAQEELGESTHLHATGLSQTAYDLLRIGAWALVIVGGLLVVTGLIRYWGAQRDRVS